MGVSVSARRWEPSGRIVEMSFSSPLSSRMNTISRPSGDQTAVAVHDARAACQVALARSVDPHGHQVGLGVVVEPAVEHEPVTVGRPGRAAVVDLVVRDLPQPGSVGVHHEDLLVGPTQCGTWGCPDPSGCSKRRSCARPRSSWGNRRRRASRASGCADGARSDSRCRCRMCFRRRGPSKWVNTIFPFWPGNVACAGVAVTRSAQAAHSKALVSISTLLLVDRPVRSIRSTIERGGCAPLNAG